MPGRSSYPSYGEYSFPRWDCQRLPHRQRAGWPACQGRQAPGKAFSSLMYSLSFCILSFIGLWRHLQDAESPFVDTCEGVSHKGIKSCLRDGQFHHNSATRRNSDCLIAYHMVGRIAIHIGVAEDRSNDMKSGKQGGARVDDEETNALPCAGSQRIGFVLVDVAVKHHIIR